MIASQDRSGWFGASDVSYIVGNYETKSFVNFWFEKMAFKQNNFTNEAMLAGTHYEHRILDYINCPLPDKQIVINELRLRVNLDGNDDNTIYEVKTYKAEKGFKVPLKYKRQVWVQMFASGLMQAEIVAYGLTENDYKNYFNEIDGNRLSRYQIEYNEKFIVDEFLPCIKYLTDCLDKGILPTNKGREEFLNGQKN